MPMNDIFTFIQDGLENFSDDGGLYDTKLKNECKELNRLLNKVDNEDYQKHLIMNNEQIETMTDNIFSEMQSNIYTNLQEIFKLLSFYQIRKDIHDPDNPEKDIRDHYFHSLQCFLLAIALYPCLSKKTCMLPKTLDIIKILFSLCIYHDIGYLYNISEKNELPINDTMNDIFFGYNAISRSKISKILSINLMDMAYRDESKKNCFLDEIRDSPEIREIWRESYKYNDTLMLQEITGISPFPLDHKKHHSFMSAVFLVRILQSRRVIKQYIVQTDLPSGVISLINPEAGSEREFSAIIKTILLHGFKMQELISLKDEFWASFLMITDELQTYGRLPQDASTGKKVLNPKYVGFQWIDGQNKLLLTYDEEYVNNRSDDKLSNAYKNHSNEKIVASLKDKIIDESLDFLII
jgi:hypothetical protein